MKWCLGLGDPQWQDSQWRREPMYVRHEKAGELFRSDGRKVTASTLRVMYEPRALEEFAAVIWRDEKQVRGEPIDEVPDSA